MSDQDTLSPDIDDELRARFRSFAGEVEDCTDTEAALRQMPRRSRPPTIRLVAIAAAFILAVVLAAVLMEDREPVDTVPSESPTTECPPPTQPRALAPGGQMKTRFAAPAISAATVLALLGACGDDGPKVLAQGEDVSFVGGPPGLSDQTMDITAEEDEGEVTGEAVFDPYGTIDLQCADTDSEDIVIVGGQLTETTDEPDAAVGDWVAVVLRDSDPVGVEAWFASDGIDSCQALLDEASAADHDFAEVAEDDDLEVG